MGGLGLLAVWGAPAAALTIGFEDGDGRGRRGAGRGGRSSRPCAATRGEAVGGGRLGVAQGLDGLAPGLSGAALSTRDLSWPYGFSVDLTQAASGAAAVWAAGDLDWRLRALDAGGRDRGGAGGSRRGTSPSTCRSRPRPRATGFTTLLFESVKGYDWIYLDALRLRPAEAGAGAEPDLRAGDRAAVARAVRLAGPPDREPGGGAAAGGPGAGGHGFRGVVRVAWGAPADAWLGWASSGRRVGAVAARDGASAPGRLGGRKRCWSEAARFRRTRAGTPHKSLLPVEPFATAMPWRFALGDRTPARPALKNAAVPSAPF
jgi:hypothetical protein